MARNLSNKKRGKKGIAGFALYSDEIERLEEYMKNGFSSKSEYLSFLIQTALGVISKDGIIEESNALKREVETLRKENQALKEKNGPPAGIYAQLNMDGEVATFVQAQKASYRKRIEPLIRAKSPALDSIRNMCAKEIAESYRVRLLGSNKTVSNKKAVEDMVTAELVRIDDEIQKGYI